MSGTGLGVHCIHTAILLLIVHVRAAAGSCSPNMYSIIGDAPVLVARVCAPTPGGAPALRAGPRRWAVMLWCWVPVCGSLAIH